jgi:SEC-C motif
MTRPTSSLSLYTSSKFIWCLFSTVFLFHCHWYKVNAFLTTTTVPSISSVVAKQYHRSLNISGSRDMTTTTAAAATEWNNICLTSSNLLLGSPFVSSFSSLRSTRLYATSPKQRKKSSSSTSKKGSGSASYSGFGGAAIEPCPCGSSLGYAKCCGKLHGDLNAYKIATAEQVVRARYSAYAKRQVRKRKKRRGKSNEFVCWLG